MGNIAREDARTVCIVPSPGVIRVSTPSDQCEQSVSKGSLSVLRGHQALSCPEGTRAARPSRCTGRPIAPFDSARGLFSEGKRIYPDAGFKAKTHVQICVRNPSCIKGYFVPPEANPCKRHAKKYSDHRPDSACPRAATPRRLITCSQARPASPLLSLVDCLVAEIK